MPKQDNSPVSGMKIYKFPCTIDFCSDHPLEAYGVLFLLSGLYDMKAGRIRVTSKISSTTNLTSF